MTQPFDRARDPASTRKYWLLFGGIAAVGLIILVVALVTSNKQSAPRPYLQDHYTRAVELDEPDGGMAYTSTKSPSTITDELQDDTNEHDVDNADGVYFLQYDDDIVAVSALAGGGSKIYIDDYRTGYRRYSALHGGFYAFGWSSTPPGAGGYRGGGPDDGK